jgi:threonylcarbamoyladenosine tRNA methylthiotransferase MtaB
VAIQTGCDDTCSFCITRIARGAHRSHPVQRIVEHVRTAAELGIREVVLTGINLAAWGSSHTKSAPAEARLGELLRHLLDETGISRIRLSSLGPQYLRQDFFTAFADPRVCDHLHLSIQSGSDSVLKRMDRGHDAATVERVVERARALRPDLALTADFIVGFPGETGTEFAATAGLVERLGFAKLHVFPFSPREGTPAAALPDGLDPAERKRRAAELRALGQATRRIFLDSQLGRRHTVLTERNETGLTTNYIRVRTPGAAEGDLVETVLARDNLAES